MKKIIILAGGISSRMKASAALLPAEDAAEIISRTKSMISIGGYPFLNYLLQNIAEAAYDEAVIVTGENDNSVEEYYSGEYKNNYKGLKLSYIKQLIQPGRKKPLGTSEAVIRVLDANPGWEGKSFTVCNSDNLYSVRSLSLLLDPEWPNAFIDYDPEGLGLPAERIKKFAVTIKDKDHYLKEIIEKPSETVLAGLLKTYGSIGISMNIWRFRYEDAYNYLLNTPLHHERDEKEIAVSAALMIKGGIKIYAHRVSELVPDLSSTEDIDVVKKYLRVT